MLHSAQSSEYVLYVNGADSKSQKKNLRASVVGAALMIAMVGAVALVVSSHKASPSEMLQTVARSDNELANNLLKAGPSASVAQLHQHIQSYANSQMLASAPTTMLGDGGAGKLCPKADVVIAKLDALYNKLQNGAAEEKDDRKAAKKKMEDDHKAYLECESSYDLAAKEKGEAKKGADYATDQFNNYKDTVKQAEKNIVTLRSDTGKKLESLKSEYDMIMTILKMLGMIEEVGPSAKGLEAGGKVVEPAKDAPAAAPVGAAAKAEVNKQIANLKQAAAKMGGVQMQQAAKLTNLMAYQETDEVKAILMKMLEDIQSQVDTANAMLADAEDDLKDQKATLAGYEQTMVDLNNKHNNAAGALIAADQQRSGCFANKKISEETYVDLLARDTMLQPSTLKEMAIIIRIELKLQDFCGSYFAQNGISTGNANVYFKDAGIDLQNPKDGRFCVTAYFLGKDIDYTNKFPNVNNKFPDYAFLADDLDFTGINEPRKALANGFTEALRIGDKKDDASLLAAGATQSLLQVQPARTQELFFGDLIAAIQNKVNEIVQNVQAKVADVKANVQNNIDNVVAKPQVNMAVKGKNSKASINVGSDGFYMEMNGVIEVSETTNYKFCVASDDLGAVFIDGKQVGGTARAGSSQCGTVALDAGYRYVQAKYTEGSGDNNIKITAAKCKKDNANDCQNLKDIRPKMSWPPVCADAVKYNTNIGLFSLA